MIKYNREYIYRVCADLALHVPSILKLVCSCYHGGPESWGYLNCDSGQGNWAKNAAENLDIQRTSIGLFTETNASGTLLQKVRGRRAWPWDWVGSRTPSVVPCVSSHCWQEGYTGAVMESGTLFLMIPELGLWRHNWIGVYLIFWPGIREEICRTSTWVLEGHWGARPTFLFLVLCSGK